MPSNVAQRLASVHPRMSAMRGESLRRNPANEHQRRVVGGEIDAALTFANISRKAAAHEMGYADDSTINRWISGAENPNFAKLYELGPTFRRGLLVAQARSIGAGVAVQTVVTVTETVEQRA
jgi:hypothetical protein